MFGNVFHVFLYARSETTQRLYVCRSGRTGKIRTKNPWLVSIFIILNIPQMILVKSQFLIQLTDTYPPTQAYDGSVISIFRDNVGQPDSKFGAELSQSQAVSSSGNDVFSARCTFPQSAQSLQ